MITKEEILSSIVKNGKYVKTSFLKKNNLTSKECFDFLYPEKIKYCKYCGKESIFESFSNGYKDFCDCKECKHKHRIECVEKTNLEKYGVKNISQLDKIKDKKKQTNLERYGTTDFLNSEQNRHNFYDENGVHKSRSKEVNERRNKTLLERYGTLDTFEINNGHEKSNSKEGRKKAKETLKKNYGVNSTWQLDKTKISIKSTNLEKYGKDSYSKTDEFLENLKQHNLEKYGTEWFLNTEEYKEKTFKTNLEKFGTEYYLSSEIRRQRELESGHWKSDEELNEYKLYHRNVWKETFKQPLESLENFEKRGRICENENAYHLDHKYSILQGFKDKIPCEIIGNIVNLEMILGTENIKKGAKCSISKEELFENFSLHSVI